MSDASDKEQKFTRVQIAWRLVRLGVRPEFRRRLTTLVINGYLQEIGWVRSVTDNAVVDAQGEPQPWASAPFVDFITPRLHASWSVFEYGAGASTIFYARRVARVLAVEHDEKFAAELRGRLPANATVVVHPAYSEAYAQAIAQWATPPVLVSVDGRDRVRCIEAARPALASEGVLVLDDAERAEYEPAVRQLREAGFKAVEFWGLPPGGILRKCTTVFYRPGNVLGL